MKTTLSSFANNTAKFRSVFNQLEKLGYEYPLSSNSLSLLENLVKDLIISKEETEQYKQLIRKVEKEKINLEKGLLPYQQDNGRLVIENSDLQGKILKIKQEHERELQSFKKQIRHKELKLQDLEFMHRITSDRVKELLNSNKTLRLALKKSGSTLEGDRAKCYSTLFDISGDSKINEKKNFSELRTPNNDNCDANISCEPKEMDRQTAELLEELEELKLDNHHQSDIIAALKCQITQKDREINRLKRALEGGRPLSAVSRDCCYQCQEKECKIKSLEEEMEETVEKLHEAMNRALHLAEKNQHLERELKDIDNMALAVEEECQNKVKNNLKNLDVMEEKLKGKNEEIKKLEDKILNLKNKIECDELEIVNLRKERDRLDKNLQAVTGEKKHLNDKINYFLLMEKNLNSEITRMQEINKSLQRQLSDMEERVMDILGTSCKGHSKEAHKKHNYALGLPNSKTQVNFKETSSSTKSFKDDRKYFDKESNECSHKIYSISLLNKIQQERDFYHNECHRLKDQLECLPSQSDSSTELLKQIKGLEKEVRELKQDNFALRRENSTVLRKVEYGEHLSCSSGDSIKIILDRLEKERDMALSDILRLQGERDALKERIKIAKENQIGEQSRLERIVRENEERIRRLEAERRDLISSQSSQRITLTNMEEQCDEYKENIRKTQNELAQMKANYSQLKTLQEQTDKSYSDIQNRYSQVEVELRVTNNQLRDLERANSDLENEISLLKKEKANLMSNITFIEKEKDGLLIVLDEKTEKVAKLELQIKKQDTCITDLNEKICHLEKKFEFALTEKTSQEYSYRNLEREVERLKEDLQQCELQKEALIRENRRIQDDLSSASKDCLTARRELESEKQDVENLKKQLQQYVSEVKKAEELLTKKESERNQMLEHFRSLSIEATNLETNNHTLESTVENTKSQLLAANSRILDLEHQIASKDSLLYSYEKQIAELTAQIAELETKLKQQVELRIRAEQDLKALRDLCSALDGQKEALRRQATSNDAEKIHLMNEVRRLSEEYEGLNQKLTHERSLSQTLEKSLTNSRQETLEHKITNKDLQTLVQQLKQKVDELTQKLESESQDVRRYQSQCAELSQQVSELRREVTNARFDHARAVEDTRRIDCVTPKMVDSEEEYPCSLASSFRSLPASSRTFTWSPDRKKSHLPECSQSDDDVKETFFEGKPLNSLSSRNIPPLQFPEDSDRTTSLESERDNLRFLFDEQENDFRKPYWKLSPLLEKCEKKTDSNTASELSSLPEDSEARNDLCKLKDLSCSEEKNLSAYPTYSVRKESSTRSDVHVPIEFDNCNLSEYNLEETSSHPDLYKSSLTFGPEFHIEEINNECTELEYGNKMWEDLSSASDNVHRVPSDSRSPSMSRADEKLENLMSCGSFRVSKSSCDNGLEEDDDLEINENTFSLKND